MVVLTNVAGLLVVAGFTSIVYSLITRQVTARRRPVYWLAMVMTAALIGIYVDFLADVLRGLVLFPDWSIRAAFVVVYIILGCLWVLVPWIDRAEFRESRKAVDSLRKRVKASGVAADEGD